MSLYDERKQKATAAKRRLEEANEEVEIAGRKRRVITEGSRLAIDLTEQGLAEIRDGAEHPQSTDDPANEIEILQAIEEATNETEILKATRYAEYETESPEQKMVVITKAKILLVRLIICTSLTSRKSVSSTVRCWNANAS